jgi:hypothetical protein
VSSLHVIRERITPLDGHLRARLTLSDDSQIEFSEYVQRSPEGEIRVVTYSYHWTDVSGNLIRRWDNTPHHPDLPGFPHHVHVEQEDQVSSSRPVSIFAVLDEAARRLAG